MKLKFIYILIIVLIIIIFLNYNIVLASSIYAFKIWLYKVFPFLFIMFVLNDILISININSLFKNNIIYILIMSLLSGCPSNAFIISNMYNAKEIDCQTANYLLLFTHFINPLFLLSILRYLFTNSVAIKLIIINYISNVLILIFNYKKLNIKNVLLNKSITFNLGNSIIKAINSLTMILGTIVFFTIITNIISYTFNINNIATLFIKGFLEVTQGLNYLKSLNISIVLKQLIAISFISFGGL